MQSSGDGREIHWVIYFSFCQFDGGIENHLGGKILGDDGDAVLVFNVVQSMDVGILLIVVLGCLVQRCIHRCFGLAIFDLLLDFL